MHSLLHRQLRKHFGPNAEVPANWGAFVEAVDTAYAQFDEDRKMLERALELSSQEMIQANSQMRAVFDAFPDLFFLIDREGRILEFNNGSQGEDSLSLGEIVGRRIQDVPSLEAAQQFQRVVESLQVHKEPMGIEYSLLIRGRIEYYEARALPLPEDKSLVIVRNISVSKDAEKAIESSHSLLEETVDKRTRELLQMNESLQHEIYERHRIETALKKTEAQFRTLVEQLPTIIYIMEAGEPNHWVYVSPQIETILGFSAAEWMSHEEMAKQNIHPEDLERVQAERVRCFLQDEKFDCEYRIASKGGHYVWCRDEAALVEDEETNEKYFQGVILDIAERKSLEDQLRQSAKLEAIGRLAGGIAHDFNNILTAIILDCHLIRESLRTDHPAGEYAAGVLASAERAASLTQQLLAYSRRQTLQPKVFDVSELVNNLKGMLKRLIGENIEMETSSFGPAFIRADPGQIEQVIINLLVNSRDAMPNGGRVTIEIDQEIIDENSTSNIPLAGFGDYIRLKVSDTGTGIADKDLGHIFEPFFTTKDQGKGTGLGLATSYGIIKQSGGSISVESNPGEGTAFTILLREVAEETLAIPLQDVVPITQTIPLQDTVLVAEDEPMVRSLASQVLRKLGYVVLEAANGEEALRIFSETPTDTIKLLLTDMVMPRLGGRDLARKLHALQPNIQIVYMSGYTSETLGESEAFLKGSSFLPKPFTPSVLAKKIQDALQAPAPA